MSVYFTDQTANSQIILYLINHKWTSDKILELSMVTLLGKHETTTPYL